MISGRDVAESQASGGCGPYVLIMVVFCVMLCYPPLYTVCKVGIKSVFAYFAEDTFYYLTVAKNSVIGFWTFDGETPTNGFHPLWQYLLTLLFGATEPGNLEAQLYLTYFVGVLFVSAGFVFTGWAVYRVTGSVWWSLWLIPGPFYLLFTAANTITYTFSPWAFMNGMETPLSILLCGIFLNLWAGVFVRCRQLVSRHARIQAESALAFPTVAAIGVVVSFMIMARLDDIFLLVALAVTLLFFADSWKGRMKRLAVLAFPGVVLLAAYGAYNHSQGLTIIPVSGLAKCSPTAAFSGNFTTFLSDFLPPIHELIRPDKYRLTGWWASAARSTGMVLPIAFAVLTGAMVLGRKEGIFHTFRENLWCLPLLLYIILKGSYNLANVRIFNQGYWYYPVAVLMLNCLVIVFAWEWTRFHGIRGTVPAKALGVVIFVLIYCFNSADIVSKGVSYEDWPYRLWQHREEMTAELLKIKPDVKLVDRTDAILSYILPVPSVTLSGFVTDQEGHRARETGRLLQYYVERGFDVTHDGVPAWHLPKNFRYRRFYWHLPSHVAFMQIEAEVRPAAATPADRK